MALHTRICDIFGIDYPIVLAGMGGASHPRLAAAVSNAGGLGILGAASCGPDQLREWIRETRKLTDRPFGVDTLLPASVRRMTRGGSSGPSPMDQLPGHMEFTREFLERAGVELPERAPGASGRGGGGASGGGGRASGLFSKDFFEAQMKVVVQEQVPVYAAGLGDPGPWIDPLHKNGTIVMSVVGAVRHARKVMDSGIDVIVAQGHDAGGHNSPIGTMALLPQVVDAANGKPVLGAGGIGDGRGVAAALMLGAEGVWIGTAFLGTEEANLFDYQKQALVESNEEGTTVSRSVTGKPARLIRTEWTRAWEQTDLEPLPMPFQSMVSGPVMQAAFRERRADLMAGFAGQGVGMIERIRPAAEVMQELVQGAEQALASASRLI
jgi:NAD(P)H-dependent flavin oxidoreductase YrpB (nitropropane dioxygenase family)